MPAGGTEPLIQPNIRKISILLDFLNPVAECLVIRAPI